MEESFLLLVVFIGHFLGCEAMHPAFNKDSGMKFGQILIKHFFIPTFLQIVHHHISF